MGIRHLLEFDAPPPAWRLYLRAFVSRKPALLPEGGQVPRIEAVVRHAAVDPGKLGRYCESTGAQVSDCLPLAYPHVLAAPLHLAVLACGAFPLRPLGLVHVHNTIVQRRPLRSSETFEMRCGVEGHRDTARGQEFDLESVMIVDGVQVWHETATLLARRSPASPSGLRRGAEPPPVQPFGSVRTASLRVDAAAARAYAAISGDLNPIHLSDATARMFGFRGAIAHGMWTLARCAAEIGANAAGGPVELDASFLAPVRIPGSLTLQSSTTGGVCEFALREAKGERALLTGTLRAPR